MAQTTSSSTEPAEIETTESSTTEPPEPTEPTESSTTEEKKWNWRPGKGTGNGSGTGSGSGSDSDSSGSAESAELVGNTTMTAKGNILQFSVIGGVCALAIIGITGTMLCVCRKRKNDADDVRLQIERRFSSEREGAVRALSEMATLTVRRQNAEYGGGQCLPHTVPVVDEV